MTDPRAPSGPLRRLGPLYRWGRPLRAAGQRLGAVTLEAVVRGAAALAPAAGGRRGEREHGRVRGGGEPSAAVARVPDEPRSIFVLRNNDIGDVLVVTPLFAALRRRFPAAAIAAGVGGWSLPVLAHNPHLSEVLTVEAPWFNKYQDRQGTLDRMRWLARSPQLREVARRRFAVGIDVLGSGWGSLLLLRAGIPYRLGVRGYAGGGGAGVQATVRFDPGEHVGRTALRLAEMMPAGATGGAGTTAGAGDASWLPEVRPQIFLSPEEVEAGERWWAAGERGRRAVRLVIGPGASLAGKSWPAASFRALARSLAAIPGLAVLALGGLGDRELAAEMAATAGARPLDPVPGLRAVFGLVAASDLVVCNSSMLLHVGAAFAKPTLVLLGPAFASARQHQAQWGYADTCRSLGPEPGGRGVATPAEALAALHELLAAEGGQMAKPR